MSQTNKKSKSSNSTWLLIFLLLLCGFAYVYYYKPELLSKLLPSAPEATAEPTPPATITIDPEPSENPGKTTITVDELQSVLNPASELITSKYYYTNAASFDNVLMWIHSDIPNPFTHSKGYIIYDGVVSVGIDVSELKYDIDNENKRIVITLPVEKVLAHEIDNSSLKSDTQESIFNNLDAEFYAQLIDGLQKGTEEKVMKNSGYLKEVRRNTELVLRNFLSASELTKDYTIQFKRTVRLD